METERTGLLEVVFVGVTMIILSLIGIASGFFTKIVFDIDGLLLINVCLLMALIFSIMLLVTLKQFGILRKKSAPVAAPPAPTSAAPPAAPKPTPPPAAPAAPAGQK
jgi:hypothetical protein